MTLSSLKISTAAVLVGGFMTWGFFEHRAKINARDEADALRLSLGQSESRAAQSELKAARAETRLSELQRKRDAVVAKSIAPSNPTPRPVDDTRAKRAERLVQLKPLLAAGMPIKGAMILFVEGKAVPQSVEFVMGKETRLARGDDGTFVITPLLNEDGTVTYLVDLFKTDAASGKDTKEKLPRVVQTPWEGFAINIEGRVFAFDPDEMSP